MLQYKFSVILIYHNCESTINSCLKSLVKNISKNTEIICVNNGSQDTSINIVLSYESQYSNIKLINIPGKVSDETAKNIGLGLASGEYVYFINGTDIVEENIFDCLYSQSSIRPAIIDKKIYKRDFLENYSEIDDIIENKFNEKISLIDDKITAALNNLSSKLEKFEQITAENIQNKIYNITCRFEQFEKFFAEKNNEYRSLIDTAIENAYKNKQEDNKYFYDEISKIYDSIHDVYEYVNKEIAQKNDELNRIYQEISKCYSYTENLAEEKNSYIQNQIFELNKSSETVKNDIENKFANYGKLIDIKFNSFISQTPDIAEKISVKSDSSAELYENIDKLYNNLNSTSEALYKEITSLYSDFTQKFNAFREEQKYLTENYVSDIKQQLTAEINSQISLLQENNDANQ